MLARIHMFMTFVEDLWVRKIVCTDYLTSSVNLDEI